MYTEYYKTSDKIVVRSSGMPGVTHSPLLVSVNYRTSLYITKKNTTWAWGDNSFKILGGTIISSRTPIKIAKNHLFSKIDTSYFHCLATDIHGYTWSWGVNVKGLLGDNTLVNKSTPVAVYGNHIFNSISAGFTHSLAIDTTGTIWGWGYNSNGQVGAGTFGLGSYITPVRVDFNYSFPAISVSAGNSHSIALAEDYTVWGWGYNYDGEVYSTYDSTIIYSPVIIEQPGFVPYKISAGGYHNLALDSSGTAWGWGYNGMGQLGSQEAAYIKVVEGDNHTFCEITAGLYHSLAIDINGKAWGWGYNYNGQLGDNSTTNRSTPVAVYGNHTFISISAGSKHNIAVDNTGKVWCWGYNSSGQLGDNTVTYKCTPVAVCYI